TWHSCSPKPECHGDGAKSNASFVPSISCCYVVFRATRQRGPLLSIPSYRCRPLKPCCSGSSSTNIISVLIVKRERRRKPDGKTVVFCPGSLRASNNSICCS